MPSLRSRLVPLVLFLRGSKRMYSSESLTRAKIERLREKPAAFAPPRRVRRRVLTREQTFEGHVVYEVSPRSGGTLRRGIYLHGGSWVFEIQPTHWSVITELVERTGATLTVPIYPLAPRTTAVETVGFLTRLAEDRLSAAGTTNFCLIGDSAGANLALVVAMQLRDRQLPPPYRTVMVAPLVDATLSDPRIVAVAATDPWLDLPGLRVTLDAYRGALPLTDPRVSPIHGDLAGLGPLLLFSGTRDLLNPDAHTLVVAARAAGVEIEFHEGRGMVHDYAVLPMPEGKAARRVIAAALAGMPATGIG